MRTVISVILFTSFTIIGAAILPTSQFIGAQTLESTVQSTIKISVCGDFVVEGPEDCEPGPPEDLNGGTCESAGFGPGTLSCTIACDFDTSLCTAPPSPAPSPAPAGGGGATTGRPIIDLPQISFFGRAEPGDTVVLLKDAQIAATTVASADGSFFFRLTRLSSGNYIFALYSESPSQDRSALVTVPVEIFPQSVINVTEISFLPGVPFIPGQARIGDLNGDGRVDLVDFSILIYWFEKPNPPAHIDLNGDDIVDLVDFSILAYYWTG